MNPYIQEFTEIIRNGSMENTYKMSWARALVELCVKDPKKHLIEFKDIGKLMFQYYWDQTIFFNLEQGPNLKKRPALHQIVLKIQYHDYYKDLVIYNQLNLFAPKE